MVACEEGLSRADYELFRRLVYKKSGINLGDEKLHLVRARLGKRMRQRGLESFRDYYKYVEADSSGQELSHLLDAISTNTTHLFREIKHFEVMRDVFTRWLNEPTWCAANPTIRIWSAGCSSGEEPYSLAMVAHSLLKGRRDVDAKILATDLSSRMLRQAVSGVFDIGRTKTVPPAYAQRYLKRVVQDGQTVAQIVPEVRRLIKFARFNLMSSTFPFRNGFHLIFCRNVMIYFDRPTQETLVRKFGRHLVPGGYLMIGHSESLTSIDHGLAYIEPTIYQRDLAVGNLKPATAE